MLVSDLVRMIESLAPAGLAEEWDNSGLQVGDPQAQVCTILAALDLNEDVLDEAITSGCDTILTHHPLLFSPVSTLIEAKPRERLLRTLVREGITVVSCHTNLDATTGGIADIAADALGLQAQVPLRTASAGWLKLVGFIPANALQQVAEAVFAAGAGGVGRYSECGFSVDGTGWFTPGEGAEPAVGEVGRAERSAETRWETVLPKEKAGSVIRAFVEAHPYEEPAFDLYAMENILPSIGLGRVGELEVATTVENLAQTVAEVFESSPVLWSGSATGEVRRVGVLPGSGRGSVPEAVGRCEVLISGEFGYHDNETASEAGVALINVPHGSFEWWAFKRWCGSLSELLPSNGVQVALSERWRDPWREVGA